MGAEIVKTLCTIGQIVRAADIDAGELKERFGNTVETVRFDFTDPSTYAATLKAVKKMFYMRPPHRSRLVVQIKDQVRPGLDALGVDPQGVTGLLFQNLHHISSWRAADAASAVNPASAKI